MNIILMKNKSIKIKTMRQIPFSKDYNTYIITQYTFNNILFSVLTLESPNENTETDISLFTIKQVLLLCI